MGRAQEPVDLGARARRVGRACARATARLRRASPISGCELERLRKSAAASSGSPFSTARTPRPLQRVGIARARAARRARRPRAPRRGRPSARSAFAAVVPGSRVVGVERGGRLEVRERLVRVGPAARAATPRWLCGSGSRGFRARASRSLASASFAPPRLRQRERALVPGHGVLAPAARSAERSAASRARPCAAQRRGQRAPEDGVLRLLRRRALAGPRPRASRVAARLGPDRLLERAARAPSASFGSGLRAASPSSTGAARRRRSPSARSRSLGSALVERRGGGGASPLAQGARAPARRRSTSSGRCRGEVALLAADRPRGRTARAAARRSSLSGRSGTSAAAPSRSVARVERLGVRLARPARPRGGRRRRGPTGAAARGARAAWAGGPPCARCPCAARPSATPGPGERSAGRAASTGRRRTRASARRARRAPRRGRPRRPRAARRDPAARARTRRAGGPRTRPRRRPRRRRRVPRGPRGGAAAGRRARAGRRGGPRRRTRPRLAAEPGRRRVHHVVAPPLRFEHARAALVARDAVVVVVEAARQAEAAVEHVGADEGARRVARAPSGAWRGSRRSAGKHVGAVVVHAVARRLEAGEDRRVRGQRQRHRGQRFLEHERRGRRARRACGVRPGGPPVGADAIGAQRVDRDEQEARGRLRRGAPAHPLEAQHQRQGQEAEYERRRRASGSRRLVPASACEPRLGALARDRVGARGLVAACGPRRASPRSRASSPRL